MFCLCAFLQNKRGLSRTAANWQTYIRVNAVHYVCMLYINAVIDVALCCDMIVMSYIELETFTQTFYHPSHKFYKGPPTTKFWLNFRQQSPLTHCGFEKEKLIANITLPHSATIIELRSP